MPEEVLLGVQLLVDANHVHERGKSRFGPNTGYVQLVAGQQHRDTERLLERCVRHGGQRHDLVVLTRGVQVGRGPAEVRCRLGNIFAPFAEQPIQRGQSVHLDGTGKLLQLELASSLGKVVLP
uniref:(northern house mosquito) hypothetical protein n=1 Tax=Culex pipiens TaxID=7175 RepID=A0A8D8FM93_CULPI